MQSLNGHCHNYLNEVFEISTENNFRSRGSFQNLKGSFCETNTGQLDLSYCGQMFWNKTPDTFKPSKMVIPSNIIWNYLC